MDNASAIRLTGLLTGGFFSVTMIGLGIPFMQRKIGPNKLAGIRMPATLNNPDLWYASNAYAGRIMVQIGIVVGLITLLYFAPTVSGDLYMGLVTVGLLVTSMVLLVKSVNYVRYIMRERTDVPAEDASGPLRVGLIASGIALAIMAAMSAYAWSKIPAGKQIVTHWGPNGPDGYSSKSTALIVFPLGMIVGLTILMAVTGWATARAPGIGKQKWITPVMWILMLLIFVVVHVVVVSTALSR